MKSLNKYCALFVIWRKSFSFLTIIILPTKSIKINQESLINAKRNFLQEQGPENKLNFTAYSPYRAKPRLVGNPIKRLLSLLFIHLLGTGYGWTCWARGALEMEKVSVSISQRFPWHKQHWRRGEIEFDKREIMVTFQIRHVLKLFVWFKHIKSLKKFSTLD